MPRPCIRVVLVAVLAAALTAGAAQARSRVFVTAIGDSYRVQEFNPDALGRLTSVGSFDSVGRKPWWLGMTSNARNLYLVGYQESKLEAFTVGAGGSLTHKDTAHGGELSTGTAPYGLAVSPDNRNIYVPSYSLSGGVWIYDVAADGSVKPHSPPSVPAGPQTDGIAVSPNGKSVYASTQTGDRIYEFNRAANGSLTAKTPGFVTAKSLASDGSHPIPGYLVLTPNGRHLYSSNYNDPSVGIFDVAPNGALTEKAASPVVGPDGAYEMAVAPNGQSLYAAGQNDGKVFQWTITAAGGLLKKSPASFTAGQYLEGIWPSPSGRNAYVVDIGTSKVAQYSADAGGALHALTPAKVSTITQPQAAIVTPDLGPLAAFKWSTKRGLKKPFDGSASHDFDGTIARYAWSFGDGTPVVVAGAKPSHRYKKPGRYKVTLTVVDDAGCWRPQTYTGQTAYCSGSPRAAVAHRVTVKRKLKKCSKYPKGHKPKRCRKKHK
jgi:6-phosphogluconolactonase (cycloisomerase 2 family)